MIRETLWMLGNKGKSFIVRLTLLPKEMNAWIRFWDKYKKYNKLSPNDKKLQLRILYPCIGDDTTETEIEPIYFYQDSWAFERIIKSNPRYHVDVGSHHKFVALLSKVLPVTMVDIRPLSLKLDTINFKNGSILNLPFDNASIQSLSSLCVIEHIGLGRYGDPLDINGSEKAILELKRVIKPGGDLYLSIPIDDENKIYFNAHRAFKEEYLLYLFKPFVVLDKKYIYGKEFGNELQSGFGVGCYHLKRPEG